MALESDGCDFVLRMAALMHDIGKPATKAVGPDGRVSFHHHEVVGARLTKAPDEGAALPEGRHRPGGRSWSGCTCASTGTAGASGPTRRCAATSPTPVTLLPRLHKLTRSDCTTRNRRKAAALAADYDALEERIARIAAEEDLARVRPDLDGNAIMELLGVPPGPVVGPGLAAPQGAAPGARPAGPRRGRGGAAALGPRARHRRLIAERRSQPCRRRRLRLANQRYVGAVPTGGASPG